MLSQELAVSATGKLPSLIRVDDEVLRVATLIKRHARGADDQEGKRGLSVILALFGSTAPLVMSQI